MKIFKILLTALLLISVGGCQSKNIVVFVNATFRRIIFVVKNFSISGLGIYTVTEKRVHLHSLGGGPIKQMFHVI